MARKRSLRAKLVAHEYLQSTKNGQKATLQDIQEKHGYSRKTVVTKMKSFKEEIAPVIAQHDRILSRIRDQMENASLDKETLVNLSIAHKNTLHDRQLLSGKSTENVAQTPTILVFGDDDPLAIQLKKNPPVDKSLE